MKLLQLKTAIFLAQIMSLSTYTGLASATCFNGELLGPARDSEDLYHVRCFTLPGGLPTTRLHAQVTLQVGSGSGGVPVLTNAVKLQTSKNGSGNSAVVSDTIQGGTFNLASCTPIGSSPSSFAYLNGGNGDYDILVDKTGADTSRTYGLIFDCENVSPGGVVTLTGTAEVIPGLNSLALTPPGSPPAFGDIDMLIDQ